MGIDPVGNPGSTIIGVLPHRGADPVNNTGSAKNLKGSLVGQPGSMRKSGSSSADINKIQGLLDEKSDKRNALKKKFNANFLINAIFLLGGAAVGATLGFIVGGPIGAAVGGLLVGPAVGLIMAKAAQIFIERLNQDEDKKARERMRNTPCVEEPNPAS